MVKVNQLIQREPPRQAREPSPAGEQVEDDGWSTAVDKKNKR